MRSLTPCWDGTLWPASPSASSLSCHSREMARSLPWGTDQNINRQLGVVLTLPEAYCWTVSSSNLLIVCLLESIKNLLDWGGGRKTKIRTILPFPCLCCDASRGFLWWQCENVGVLSSTQFLHYILEDCLSITDP